MLRVLPRLGALLLAALTLAGCGQKGPLCLQEPKPAAVPVTAPAAASDGSAPAVAATPPSAPAVPSTSAPNHPRVPGYTRCH